MKKEYTLKPLDGKGKVYVGIPRERFYFPTFVDNRDKILMTLQKENRSVGYFQADGHRVDRNRDAIAEQFLSLKEKPDWLLMLDSDMEHPINCAERLTAWGKPIVGGLYFHRGESHDPFIFKEAPPGKDKYGREVLMWEPLRSVVYDFLTSNGVPYMDGAIIIDDTETSPLVECDAVATGCIAIHRSVLEIMEQPIFEYRSKGTSEDMMFCYEAKHNHGIPIYCDISTISGHYTVSPQGQAQFRYLFEKRGMTLSFYTPKEIAEWYADFLGISKEDSFAKIQSTNAHIVGEYWNSKFGKRIPSVKEVNEFYKDSYTGQLYLYELAHWNSSEAFSSVKQLFKDIRNLKVMELGSGIGSVAIQLAIQGNDVLAVEINDVLRNFTQYRIKKTKQWVVGTFGDITISDDTWKQVIADQTYDVIVSADTFEHLPLMELKDTLRNISRVIKPGGKLIYHANFQQQELYPMHFDHSEIWDSLLVENGFIPITNTLAVKGR